MKKEIKHTWYFKQSPQEIWEHLTKPELLAQWLMPNDFQPTVGHRFRFTNPNGTFVHCEIIEVNPFTNLSYLWQNDCSAENNNSIHSKVTWTLTPIEIGTELLLVHNGFRLFEDFAGHNNGWITSANKLVERLKKIHNANTTA